MTIPTQICLEIYKCLKIFKLCNLNKLKFNLIYLILHKLVAIYTEFMGNSSATHRQHYYYLQRLTNN